MINKKQLKYTMCKKCGGTIGHFVFKPLDDNHLIKYFECLHCKEFLEEDYITFDSIVVNKTDK